MNLPWIICDINWSNISSDWMGWFTKGYVDILGIWFYPMILAGIIGYVYALSHSVTAAAVLIALAFGVFGISGIFSGVPEFAALSWGIVVASFSAVFVAIFTGRKR